MLNYRIYGTLEHTQRPLVVLHGLLGSLDNWNTFASQQEGKRPVIAIDMRNHGKSPHEVGMSYQLMVDDVFAVLDHLGIQTYDLMGHSMGGKTAMLMAMKSPSSIDKLIVVDMAPVNYPPRHQNLLQALNAIDLASLKSRKEADQQLSTTIKHPFERGFLLKNLGRHRENGFYWQCNLAEISRHYLKLTSFPQTNQSYSGEILFIAGGKSDYVTEETWLAAQTIFSSAQLITIEQAGHLPHVQTPDAFTQAVDSFLA